MKIIDGLIQGSPEWARTRKDFYCSSEAPVMMGDSQHMRRDELLALKAMGIEKDVSDYVRRVLFDKGHEAEAAIRPHIEAEIGEDLYTVTGTIEIDGLALLASFDGLTMDESLPFEHKLYNRDLAEAVKSNSLSPHYYWQLEHAMLVCGASKVLFATSNGTPDMMEKCYYESRPERRRALIAGWKQFAADLASYEYTPPAEVVTAAPMKDLPMPAIRVDGQLALVSNLDVFGAHLTKFIGDINRKPDDDEGFASAEAAIKVLEKAEAALLSAKSSALAQTASIDEMCRTVDNYHETARQVRLELQKMVKARKEQLKTEAVNNARIQVQTHMATLNKGLGGNWLNDYDADFPGVIRGKKTLASIRSALNDEVARAKMGLNDRAEKIRANLKTLDGVPDYRFLFNDLSQIIGKEPDDFASLVTVRVDGHKRKEEERLEKIRAEEAAKAKAAAEKEAREKVEREQREAKEKADREAREAEEARLQEEREAQQATKIADTPKPAEKISEPVQEQVAQHKAHTSFQGMGAKHVPHPTDDAILLLISDHFNVDRATARQWIREMATRIEAA